MPNLSEPTYCAHAISDACCSVLQNHATARPGTPLASWHNLTLLRKRIYCSTCCLALLAAAPLCCCQEELRDKERAVKDLAAEADSASSQLHGLQTVLTAKTAQCNRLEAEARQVERQLKQVQAAAAAEQEGLRGEMGALSGRVGELEGQVVAAQQREAEQQAQLVAVRAKVRVLHCRVGGDCRASLDLQTNTHLACMQLSLVVLVVSTYRIKWEQLTRCTV